MKRLIKELSVVGSVSLLAACSLIYEEEPVPEHLLAGVEAGVSGGEAGVTSGVEAGVTSGVEAGVTSGVESGVEAGTGGDVTSLVPAVESVSCVEDAEWTRADGFEFSAPPSVELAMGCTQPPCSTHLFDVNLPQGLTTAVLGNSLEGELPPKVRLLQAANADRLPAIDDDQAVFMLPFRDAERCSNPMGSVNVLSLDAEAELCVLDGSLDGIGNQGTYNNELINPPVGSVLNAVIDDFARFPDGIEGNPYEINVERSILRIERTMPLSAQERYITFNLDRSVLISNQPLAVYPNSEVHISNSVIYLTNPNKPIIDLKQGNGIVTLKNVVVVTKGEAFNIEGGTFSATELYVLPPKDSDPPRVIPAEGALHMHTGDADVTINGLYFGKNLQTTAIKQERGALNMSHVVADEVKRFWFWGNLNMNQRQSSLKNAYIRAEQALYKAGGDYIDYNDLCDTFNEERFTDEIMLERVHLEYVDVSADPVNPTELINVSPNSTLSAHDLSLKGGFVTSYGVINLSSSHIDETHFSLTGGALNLLNVSAYNTTSSLVSSQNAKLRAQKLIWAGERLLVHPEASSGGGNLESKLCQASLAQTPSSDPARMTWSTIFELRLGELDIKDSFIQASGRLIESRGVSTFSVGRSTLEATVGTSPIAPLQPLSLILSAGQRGLISDTTLNGSVNVDSVISSTRNNNLTLTRVNLKNIANVGLTRLGRADLGSPEDAPIGELAFNQVHFQINDLSPNNALHPMSVLLLEGALSDTSLEGAKLYTDAPVIVNSTGLTREEGEALLSSWLAPFSCHGDAYLLDCNEELTSDALEQVCRDF